ncbi:MAG: hypothetical protein H0V29_10910 [Thermoleophilaceae bacterium]|nr:hypothetical protein [Thermoleophilaceae bacterium]
MPEEITSVIAELEQGLAGPPSFRRNRTDPAVWLARISDQVGQAGRAAWRSAETRQRIGDDTIRTTASHPAVFRTRMICVAVLAVEAAVAAEASRTMREPDDAVREAMLEAIESDLTELEARELEQLQLELLRDVGTGACTGSLLGRTDRYEPGAERALDAVRGGRERALSELRDECIDIAVSAVRAAALQR